MVSSLDRKQGWISKTAIANLCDLRVNVVLSILRRFVTVGESWCWKVCLWNLDMEEIYTTLYARHFSVGNSTQSLKTHLL